MEPEPCDFHDFWLKKMGAKVESPFVMIKKPSGKNTYPPHRRKSTYAKYGDSRISRRGIS